MPIPASLFIHRNGWRHCATAYLDGRPIQSNRDGSNYSDASAERDVIVQLCQRSDADAKRWVALYMQGIVSVDVELF